MSVGFNSAPIAPAAITNYEFALIVHCKIKSGKKSLISPLIKSKIHLLSWSWPWRWQNSWQHVIAFHAFHNSYSEFKLKHNIFEILIKILESTDDFANIKLSTGTIGTRNIKTDGIDEHMWWTPKCSNDSLVNVWTSHAINTCK